MKELNDIHVRLPSGLGTCSDCGDIYTLREYDDGLCPSCVEMRREIPCHDDADVFRGVQYDIPREHIMAVKRRYVERHDKEGRTPSVVVVLASQSLVLRAKEAERFWAWWRRDVPDTLKG